MSENNEFELPDQDPPEINIPDLKKKEKERKKAGAAWGGGTSGTPFTGAVGGSGVSGARAAASMARSAASAARAGAGIAGQAGAGAISQGGFLAALTSSFAGKALLFSLAAGVLGGGAMVAYKMLGPGAESASAPELGNISSTVKYHGDQGPNGLDYAAASNRGQIKWENAEAGSAPTAENAEKTEPAEAAEAGNPAEKAQAAAGAHAGRIIDRMDHNLSGAKLGSSPGAGSSIFGGKSIFANAAKSAFGPSVGSGGGLLSKFGLGKVAKTGRGGALVRKPSNASSRMNLRGFKSNRALSQLRGMTPYNAQMRAGTGQASEANSAAATTQFEGSQVSGGLTPTSPTDGQSIGGVGAGATPNVMGGADSYSPTIEQCGDDQYWNGSSCVSVSIPGVNVTPWQGMVDVVQTLIQLAAMLLIIGGILILLGNIPFLAFLKAIGIMICMIAGVLGAICAVFGAIINMQGGSPQGNMAMIAGGVIGAGVAITIASGAAPAIAALVYIAIGSISSMITMALGSGGK
jgi:hypothetical protein